MKAIKVVSSCFLFSVLFLGVSFAATTDGLTVKSAIYNDSTRLRTIMAYPGLVWYKNFDPNVTSNVNADYAMGSNVGNVVCTRGASAPTTYVNSSGKLILVTDNSTPVFDYGYYDTSGFHSTIRGLNVQGSSTNLLVNSVTDSNSAWSTDNLQYSGTTYWVVGKSNGGATTNTIGTGVYQSSPSLQITNAGSSATDVMLYSSSSNNTFSITSGTVYTLSFYVWSDSTKTLGAQVYKSDGSATSGLDTTFSTVSNTWVKVILPFTASATQTSIVRFTLGNNSTYNVKFDAMQLEAKPWSTSFIPTTVASLSRNVENARFSLIANRNPHYETVFVKFAPLGGSFSNDNQYRTVFDTDGPGTPNRSFRKYNNGFFYWYCDGSTAKTFSTGPALNTSYVIAGTCQYSSPSYAVFVNGSQENTTGTSAWTLTQWTGTYFYVGGNNGNTQKLYGIIQEVAIFNRVLSSAEILAVSNIMNN